MSRGERKDRLTNHCFNFKRMERWLKLKAAARYAAIGKHRLIELSRSGVVRGFQDPDSLRGDWIFDRLSLDAYRERQLGCVPTVSERAKAIMMSVKL